MSIRGFQSFMAVPDSTVVNVGCRSGGAALVPRAALRGIVSPGGYRQKYPLCDPVTAGTTPGPPQRGASGAPPLAGKHDR